MEKKIRWLTTEKKILPPLLQGFELATFQSRVRRSNHWAILPPLTIYSGYYYLHVRAFDASIPRYYDFTGGDLTHLTSSQNLIRDNHIWDHARYGAQHNHGIKIGGVHATVSHNHLHHGQYTGIWWSVSDPCRGELIRCFVSR